MTEPTCTCYPVPEHLHTTHYGATDPASTLEPNPDCPVHFPAPKRFDQAEVGEWITVRIGDAIDVVTLDVFPLRPEVMEYAGQHGVIAGFDLLPDNIDGTVYGVYVELENGRPTALFTPYELMLPLPVVPPVLSPVLAGDECPKCERDEHDACLGDDEVQPCACDSHGHPDHDTEAGLL